MEKNNKSNNKLASHVSVSVISVIIVLLLVQRCEGDRLRAESSLLLEEVFGLEEEIGDLQENNQELLTANQDLQNDFAVSTLNLAVAQADASQNLQLLQACRLELDAINSRNDSLRNLVAQMSTSNNANTTAENSEKDKEINMLKKVVVEHQAKNFYYKDSIAALEEELDGDALLVDALSFLLKNPNLSYTTQRDILNLYKKAAQAHENGNIQRLAKLEKKILVYKDLIDDGKLKLSSN